MDGCTAVLGRSGKRQQALKASICFSCITIEGSSVPGNAASLSESIVVLFGSDIFVCGRRISGV